jgi:AAA domain, putative AbiEii toxin, Type IV TA system
MVDSKLEDHMSRICREAFDQPLTLSRVMGAPLSLHVGSVAIAPSVVPTEEYIEALRSLPRLEEQGDGMKSFLGLMLAIITSQFPIVLVDEPEAFLHPPQARMLGRRLASEPQEGTQVVVATHDVHILQGLLDAPDREVTVARIVRTGDVNRLSVLSPDDLRGLWQDPLLKYSAVLEGLFHRGVVVSESDSDSRFYAAVLDEAGGDEIRRPHDLHFTQAGGKQRLHTVIAALRAVDVPVAAIADFDALREQSDLEKIVEALGGTWELLSPYGVP